MDIQTELFRCQDITYQAFSRKLIPNIPPETVIGVRTPALRALAKEMKAEREDFLAVLPHTYFEENQLHAFLLEREKDFSRAVALVDAFLPFVDNWATCDQLRPKVFGKHWEKLKPEVYRWIHSERVYTMRFGVETAMGHLDGDFDPELQNAIADLRSEDYYGNMMLAWYFSTALVKQWEATLSVLLDNRLDRWVHNKTIQKAVESDRISPERKAFLKTLKR